MISINDNNFQNELSSLILSIEETQGTINYKNITNKSMELRTDDIAMSDYDVFYLRILFNGEEYRITHFYLKNKGYGRVILNMLINFAQKQKFKNISVVNVDKDNIAMRKVCEGFNVKEQNKSLSFYKLLWYLNVKIKQD